MIHILLQIPALTMLRNCAVSYVPLKDSINRIGIHGEWWAKFSGIWHFSRYQIDYSANPWTLGLGCLRIREPGCGITPFAMVHSRSRGVHIRSKYTHWCHLVITIPEVNKWRRNNLVGGGGGGGGAQDGVAPAADPAPPPPHPNRSFGMDGPISTLFP